MRFAPVFVINLWLFAQLPILAEDWPNWRGPRFDGVSTELIPETLPEALPIKWQAQVGTGFSTFAVSGERVLTMGNRDEQDTVWCLDAETGRTLWQHSYDCPLDPRYYEGGPGGTPTVHGDAVYTLSKKGHAYRLDLETGEVVWARDLTADHDLKLPEWSFACSAVIEGNKVLLNAGRGGIALDCETGKTLWIPDNETSGYASIVPFAGVDKRPEHLLFSAKALTSLNISDGVPNWTYLWKSSRGVNAADPVIVGKDIVVSSSAGTKRIKLSVDGTLPTDVWHQRDLKWYFNPGVLIDDHIYSLHGTTHRPTELICTDAATGDSVWIEEGFGSGGLMAAGKHLIVFDLGMLTIFKASADGFHPVLQQKILEGKCWTSPVIANGVIYCRNATGEVAAVEIPQPETD